MEAILPLYVVDHHSEREWYADDSVSESDFTAAFLRPVKAVTSGSISVIFRGLAELWKRETRGFSLQYQRMSHPSYRAIIVDLREDAIPLILAELQKRPDFWFEALRDISGDNPVLPNASFDEAVNAWLIWGQEEGYLREDARS